MCFLNVGLCSVLSAPQVFHVAYVLIKFANSPRPDLWVLERSTDFGHTYQPWQYFACESPGARGVPWGGPHALSGQQGALTPGFCVGQGCRVHVPEGWWGFGGLCP